MKKGESICKQLGIRQEELAMFLKISKGQLAMFEIGKRDIPAAKKLQLVEMVSNIQKNKMIPESFHKILIEEKKKTHDWLLQEFKDIKFKELQLERKIKKIQEVREEAFKALEVVHYLESEKDDNDHFGMAEFIGIRVKNTLKKYSLQYLQELEIKKRSLEMLKLQIEKKLKS